MNTVGSEHAAAPLTSDGWGRRFTAMGARLNEAVTLYRELGYEVWLAPADDDPAEIANGDACAGCVVITLARTIYTRFAGGAAGDAHAQRE